MAVVQELLSCSFEGNFQDATGRHVLANSDAPESSAYISAPIPMPASYFGLAGTGVTFSNDSKVGSQSAQFDGTSFLYCVENTLDWSFGGTYNYAPAKTGALLTDVHFTIECWVKPKPGGQRFYPIVGSFAHHGGYKTGWYLWLDTQTSRLNFLSHFYGDWYGSSMQSFDIVPMDTWTNIVVMCWRVPRASLPQEVQKQ